MTSPHDTGRALARRRHRQRSAIIAGVVAIVVFGGAGYSMAYVAGWAGGAPKPTPTCTHSAPPPPQHAVRLNVYNASGEKGQASTVAEAMAARGFDLAVVSNDPYKEKLDGVGQIRFGPAGRKFAEKYVKPLAPKAKMVEDGRTGTSVDLALGKDFPHLKKAAKPTPQAAAESDC